MWAGQEKAHKMSESLTQQPIKPTRARRWLAAGWFAGFAFLTMALLFLHGPIALAGMFLYLLLPAVAGAVAGYLWGGAISDSRESYALAVLRGLGVTAGALVIFAVFFVILLPLFERGWSFRSVGGLFLATLFFGMIMTGPISLTAGMVASVTLHALGRRMGQEPHAD